MARVPPITQSQSSKLNLSTSYPSLFRGCRKNRNSRAPRPRRPVELVKIETEEEPRKHIVSVNRGAPVDFSRFVKQQADRRSRGSTSGDSLAGENSLLVPSVYSLLIMICCGSYGNLRIVGL